MLAGPALPARLAVPALGRIVIHIGNRLPIDRYADGIAHYVHADPARVSPESIAVSVEDPVLGRGQPWRLSAFVVAARSLLHSILSPREMFERVDRAQMPVLVVWGDADQLIGSQVIEHLLERRPDWQLTVLEAIGHMPLLEAPDRYSEAVTAWLWAPTACNNSTPARVGDWPSARLLELSSRQGGTEVRS